jgi:hypothetical protein
LGEVFADSIAADLAQKLHNQKARSAAARRPTPASVRPHVSQKVPVSEPAQPFLLAPWPQQKRMAQAVYKEYQSSDTGIRVCDLPEALEHLGFKKKDVPRSFRQAVHEIDGLTRNMTISLEQWLQIVERFIKQCRDGHHHNSHNHHPTTQRPGDDTVESRPRENRTAELRRRHSQSRIKAMVDADKRHWAKTRKAQRRATLQMLAPRKVDYLEAGWDRPRGERSNRTNPVAVDDEGAPVLDIADAFLSGSVANAFLDASSLWDSSSDSGLGRSLDDGAAAFAI